MLVRFGYPREVESVYTNGDCWLLAGDLNRLYGYPLIAFHRSELSYDRQEWCHFGVLLGETEVMDIRGIRSLVDAETEWGIWNTWDAEWMMDEVLNHGEVAYPDVNVSKYAQELHGFAQDFLKNRVSVS